MGQFPPYAYVPGGPWPHPKSAAEPAGVEAAATAYRRGLELFNAGFYWEAHEAWEGLWHAAGRKGPTADAIKGLIKLAAAGVKVRQHQRHGVVTHARRAAECFRTARAVPGGRFASEDLDRLIAAAVSLESRPPVTRLTPADPPEPVLGIRLDLPDLGPIGE